MSEPTELGEFSCPRCDQLVTERFYGPCGSCRDELARVLHAESRELATEAYVPKMNVVPNQVALKD